MALLCYRLASILALKIQYDYFFAGSHLYFICLPAI